MELLSTWSPQTLIGTGFCILLVLWGIASYNRFVSRRRHMGEAWSGIAVQLKRRHDLIPNLVESVKGYARHEQELFEDLARHRSISMTAMQGAGPFGGTTGGTVGGTSGEAGAPSPTAALIASENALSAGLGKLFALAEAYPTLRAAESFLSLQQALQDVEDQLQMARRYYNGTVRSYMIQVESFPSLIIAKMFGFGPAAFFELESPAEAAVPTVKF